MSPDSQLQRAERDLGTDRRPAATVSNTVTRPAAAVPGGDPAVLRRAVRVVVAVAVAALLLAVIRALVVQSFVIPTGSMEPTLQAGDRVLVSRLDDRFGDVHRGDVIVFDGDGVFDPPLAQPASLLARLGRTFASALGVPVGEHDYVKRVIGLPGDRVMCCDAAGRVTVNGSPLTERYLPSGTVPSLVRFDVVVPEGRLWVMGDNRSVSADSRAHLGDPGGGTVPLDHVVGRVVAVWWPFGRVTGVGTGDPTRATSAG